MHGSSPVVLHAHVGSRYPALHTCPQRSSVNALSTQTAREMKRKRIRKMWKTLLSCLETVVIVSIVNLSNMYKQKSTSSPPKQKVKEKRQ